MAFPPFDEPDTTAECELCRDYFDPGYSEEVCPVCDWPGSPVAVCDRCVIESHVENLKKSCLWEREEFNLEGMEGSQDATWSILEAAMRAALIDRNPRLIAAFRRVIKGD